MLIIDWREVILRFAKSLGHIRLASLLAISEYPDL